MCYKVTVHALEILMNYEYRTAPNDRTAPCPGVEYIGPSSIVCQKDLTVDKPF